MTALPTAADDSGSATGSAPRRRRIGGWIVIAIVLLVVGATGATLSELGRWSERGALDPQSAGALGTRALVEILRDHGVEVIVARDRQTAMGELDDGPATLVLPDAPALSDDALTALTGRATDVVLIEPRSRTLDLLLPGSQPAGVATGDAIEPACDLADAVRSGAVAPGALYSAGSGPIDRCYPVDDGFGLLVGPGSQEGDGRVAVVDGRDLFTNQDLAENGNAALAVNIMGRHPVLVWYVPGLGDSDLENTDPGLGELTPPWVSPVIVLLLVAGIAAGVWRGRRFGPLVAERLPVSVRASETTEGRARLYARSRDPLHAADQLRIPALTRIGRALGLGSAASAIEVADAAAAVTGIPRDAVRGVLIEDVPRRDADLVTLDSRIRHLEDAVRAVVRPERNTR